MSDTPVWVESDSYHTAIIVPSQWVRECAPELTPVLDGQAFVRFGWGDREYYGSSEKNPWKLFKALFLPTRAVMEVSNFPSVAAAGDKIAQLQTAGFDMAAMLRAISESFYWGRGPELELVRTEAGGLYYYRARGIYHLWKNCNNWTAKMLYKGGAGVHYRLAFFSNWVFRQL